MRTALSFRVPSNMSRKTLIIAEDDHEADTNPFSFRQFLRTKSLDSDPDRGQDRTPAGLFSLDPADGNVIGDAAHGVDACCPLRSREQTSSAEQVVEEPTELTSSEELQQLQQENRTLRGTIADLQSKILQQERRAALLSRQLTEQQRREEKEAGVLENVVHSVEQNLDLMTKRAQKSESHVTKLKSEVKQLQTQVRALQQDNERLRSSHSDVVTTMRNDAQLASEYLNKTVSHAHFSLRRLQDESETLQLISQLLLSIGRISELNPATHSDAHTHP